MNRPTISPSPCRPWRTSAAPLQQQERLFRKVITAAGIRSRIVLFYSTFVGLLSVYLVLEALHHRLLRRPQPATSPQSSGLIHLLL